jgi:hypothetical protein
MIWFILGGVTPFLFYTPTLDTVLFLNLLVWAYIQSLETKEYDNDKINYDQTTKEIFTRSYR